MTASTKAFRAIPFAGTLSAGKPAATFPGAVAGDAQLAIAVDREQTKLAITLSDTATSMTVQNAAGLAIWSLLSIEDEIVQVNNPIAGNVVPIRRGFDGTTPALHLAGATVAGLIDAYHHNTLVAEIQAIETALGPNLSNITSSLLVWNTPYNFPPQTPGGSLIVGANSIVLSPVPAGVNGTDQQHYLYISGGTGTPEAARIIGGTAVAGQPSGTLIIQCANTHSGAWQISSVMAGIPEANSAIAATGGTIMIPAGIITARGPWVISTPNVAIMGQGTASVIQAAAGAALVNFIASTSGARGFAMRNLCVDGNRANGGMNAVPGTSVWSIQISSSDTTIQNCEIRFSSQIGVFIGDSTVSPTHIVIDNCYIHDNGGNTVPGSHHPTPGGFGTGIFSGGAAAPIGITVTRCRIEKNYNTVSTPGDSCAMNLSSTQNIIAFNLVVDNFNVGGGQVVVSTTGSPADIPTDSVIVGNIVMRNGSFGGDNTTGLEIDSSYMSIVGNTIYGCEVGIGIEEGASHVAVTGNVVRNAASAGLAASDGAGTDPSPSFLTVCNNSFSNAQYAMILGNKLTNSSFTGNNFFATFSSGNPIAGYPAWPAAAKVEIRDNPGFNGQYTSGVIANITVGPSPFMYTAGPSPEMIYINSGTVSSVVKVFNGTPTSYVLASTTNCSILVPPNQQIQVTYTVAPAMTKDVL